MKKLALSSLIAVFAVSGAHAANVIDGNPLYMPKAGHFYSVTDLSSHTENDTPWGAAESFGYGILNNFAINVDTSMTENKAFDEFAWDYLKFGATFRALDMGAWKVDALGAFNFGGGLYVHPDVPGEDSWFNHHWTNYTWTVGARGGYTTSRFTVAAKALFNYSNSEAFKWNADEGEQGIHTLVLGVDGQYVLCDKLNLVAGVEYTGILDKELYGTPGAKIENGGTWGGMFGVNYNIDATKYIGVYVNGTMDHWKGDRNGMGVAPGAEKGWGFQDGFGYGVKFGIDF